MRELLVRIVIETIAVFAFGFNTWLLIHPKSETQMFLRFFRPFMLFPHKKESEFDRLGRQLYGCIFAIATITLVLFLIRDWVLLISFL